MVSVRMMQSPIHQIVRVVAVGDGFMAAVRPMLVLRVTSGSRLALLGVGPIHGNHVLVHMVTMGMVEMTIMEVVHMSVVDHRRMAALRSVLVLVVGMLAAGHDSVSR